MVWKLSRWSGSFPNSLTTFQMVLKVYSRKDPYIAHFWHTFYFKKLPSNVLIRMQNASFVKWNKDNLGVLSCLMFQKVESNPPFNRTQWVWWLVTVGVREMSGGDRFYPHHWSPAVSNLPPTDCFVYTDIPTDTTFYTWLKFGHISKAAAFLPNHISEFQNVK